MNALNYLFSIVIDLYLMLVILRIWLQASGADFYNPLSQFTVKATQPIIAPMRRVLPSLGRIDTASVLLALTVSCSKWIILMLMQSGQVDILSTLVLGTLGCIKEAGSLLFWMLIIRALLSWVSQGYNPIEMVLSQLTEPFMAPIRRVIPPLGGLDLTPMIVIIALNFINIFMGDLLGTLWLMA